MDVHPSIHPQYLVIAVPIMINITNILQQCIISSRSGYKSLANSNLADKTQKVDPM